MNSAPDPYAAPAYQPDPHAPEELSAFTKWIYLSTLSLTTVFCFFAGGIVNIFSSYENVDIGNKLLWALVGLPCTYRIFTVYRGQANIAVHAKKWFPAILRFFAIILMALSLAVSVLVVSAIMWRTVSSYIQFHFVDMSYLRSILGDNLISGAMVYIGLPGLLVFEFSQLLGYLVRRVRQRRSAA